MLLFDFSTIHTEGLEFLVHVRVSELCVRCA
jgi:hypothetical protein